MRQMTARKKNDQRPNPFIRVSSKNTKSNNKKKKARGGHSSDLRGPAGFFLLCLAVVSIVSLVSHLYEPSRNLLGKYLGYYLSTMYTGFSGKLPSLFIPVILFLAGWHLVAKKDPSESYRKLFFVSALFAEFCILLSITNMGEGKSWEQFYSTGGILGNFIAQNLLTLVFGTQKIGAFFITLLVIVGTMIWGFRVDIYQLMVRIRQCMEWVAFNMNGLFRNLGVAYSDAKGTATLTPPGRGARGGSMSEKERPVSRKKAAETALLDPEDEEADAVKGLSDEEIEQLPVSKALMARLEKRQREFLNEHAGLVIREGATDKTDANDSFIDGPVEAPFVETEAPAEPALEKSKKSRKSQKQAETEAAEAETTVPVDDTAIAEGLEAGTDGVENAVVPVAEPAPAPEPEPVYDEYVIPSVDLLEDKPAQGRGITDEEISANARKLEEKLKDFRINGVISEVCPGPVITRYELQLAPGQKVAQVESLARDLAVAMAVQKIRICLVEGKSAIGIEMPNPKRQVVYFKECAKAPQFKSEDDEIKVVLGRDPAGNPVVVDMVKMPHMLIAGTTGSGKSVATNTFLASILLAKRPDEVKLILIDPKVVEMNLYNGIPHLLSNVITTPREAIAALKWTVTEMNRRYQVLANSTCRNIAQFNEKVKDGSIANSRIDEKDKKRLAYIVIIVDELADLMMAVGKELEDEIVRIAQKARAVGIHLILATQRPEAKIVTGLIKSNMPCKVALTVNTAMDSRIIIDEKGAEALLGRGDMLYKSVEMRDATRVHGAFIETRESEQIVEFARNQNVKKEMIKSFEKEDKKLAVALPGGLNAEMDELREAARILVTRQQGSTSMLQRKLSIGYAKAGRLMDQLEEAGIVGPNMGSKSREVLVSDPETIDAYLQAYAQGGLDFTGTPTPDGQ